MSNKHRPAYVNAEKNRPFSGLQHQAQFGLNLALAIRIIIMLIMMYFNIILLARSKFTEKNGLNIIIIIIKNVLI